MSKDAFVLLILSFSSLKEGEEDKDKKGIPRDFPGSPMVKTPCFHCREPEFDTWSGN